MTEPKSRWAALAEEMSPPSPSVPVAPSLPSPPPRTESEVFPDGVAQGWVESVYDFSGTVDRDEPILVIVNKIQNPYRPRRFVIWSRGFGIVSLRLGSQVQLSDTDGNRYCSTSVAAALANKNPLTCVDGWPVLAPGHTIELRVRAYAALSRAGAEFKATLFGEERMR